MGRGWLVALQFCCSESVQFWISRLMPPSPRQLAALAACLDAPDGSVKQAAHCFGVGYDRMRHILHELYRDLGVHSQGQAVARLDERYPGWRHKLVPRATQNAVCADLHGVATL